MTLVSEHIEPDTRERILVAAERLFREIGYQKTTVADIAKVLRMSPANVYRFFDSKKAIHEGVARAMMGEVEDRSQGDRGPARSGGLAPARADENHPPHELGALCRRFQAARDGRDRDGGELGRLRRPYGSDHPHHRRRHRPGRRIRRILGARPAGGGVVLLCGDDQILPSADDRANRRQAGADDRPDDRFYPRQPRAATK